MTLGKFLTGDCRDAVGVIDGIHTVTRRGGKGEKTAVRPRYVYEGGIRYGSFHVIFRQLDVNLKILMGRALIARHMHDDGQRVRREGIGEAVGLGSGYTGSGSDDNGINLQLVVTAVNHCYINIPGGMIVQLNMTSRIKTLRDDIAVNAHIGKFHVSEIHRNLFFHRFSAAVFISRRTGNIPVGISKAFGDCCAVRTFGKVDGIPRGLCI